MEFTVKSSLIEGGRVSMFVDFVRYPYPQNYIPINIQQSNEWPNIVMHQTSYPQNNIQPNHQYFDKPQTLAAMYKNDFTVSL